MTIGFNYQKKAKVIYQKKSLLRKITKKGGSKL